MNEVENEDLVFTLETIVDKFGEEMAPYALGLCQNLVLLICLLMSMLALLFLFSFNNVNLVFRLLHFGNA